MKQLDKTRYEKVRHLYQDNYPNLPLIYGVIEQHLPGEIWVDDENTPKTCLLITGAAYCYQAGYFTENDFIECLDRLKKKPSIKLAMESQPQFDIEKYGFHCIDRRQYRYPDKNPSLPVYENTSGYEIKKILDIKTFNACLWKPLMTDLFGSQENFLKKGFGFILWDAENQMIASEAYGIPSNQFVEIGTITHENYRGKKLSTILCNYLIRYVVAKNLQPIWSCDEENISSWKVAEKQGMVHSQYCFYCKDQKV